MTGDKDMNLIKAWRQRRLQRELDNLLTARSREQRIHEGHVNQLDARIRETERRLDRTAPNWQAGMVTMAVWTSD